MGSGLLAGVSVSTLLGALGGVVVGWAVANIMFALNGWRGARRAVPAARKGFFDSVKTFGKRVVILSAIALVLVAAVIASKGNK